MRAPRALQRIIDAAHAEGTLPDVVKFADVGMVLVRLSRPLPGPIPAELNDRLAHRHLELFVEGMRSLDAQIQTLNGPRLTREDLRRMLITASAAKPRTAKDR